MDDYESGSASPDGHEEDDEEEYEGAGNRLLGFMFGNVDNSGDLDADYLDEDAKEHLAALADKLGASLTEIDLSVKSLQTSADTAEQDYDEKAEDAVDYEDIDEQYEDPDIQAATEEDHLLPKKEYIASGVSMGTLEPRASVFDDENYDEEEKEEEDIQKGFAVMDTELEVETISLSGEQAIGAISEEKFPQDHIQPRSLASKNLDSDLEGSQEEEADAEKGPPDGKGSTPLPILCIEDGMVILRFSEIFGIHEPSKKEGKRDHRYSIFKDKYKSKDVSHIVEEDEEAFLKVSSHVIPLNSHAIQPDMSVSADDDLELAKFGVERGNSEMSLQSQKKGYDSCLSAEPLNNDITISLSAGWQSPLCPGFYSLDQQDWENGILWDNSSTVSDNSVESYDTVGSDLGSSFTRETERESGPKLLSSKLPAELDEKGNNFFLSASSVILESFGSREPSQPGNLLSSESRCHPQILRLESQLEVHSHDHADGGRENSVKPPQSDVVRRFSQLTLQNREIVGGSWVDDITWDLHKPKPKLILDLQDEQMLFEILDNKDSKHLQLHSGAMIITRPLKSRVSPEQPGHGYQSGWQFNISNDKFYMNRKLSQQLQSNTSKRTAYGTKVHHSAPAIKLQTMKLKLSNKDLANFHRPKALWYPHDNEVAVKEQGKLPTQGPMKIILKSLGGKGSKLHVDAEETLSSVKAKASKKLDFKPSETVKLFYLGKELEDHKSLVAQNVQPNSLVHLVRTKIHLLPRAQRIPGENKSLRPPGAFKKKSDLSTKDGHIFLMEYCEERPLLLSNAGMGANLCTYHQKSSPGDQTGVLLRNGNHSLGNVAILEPNDKSPFLGDITAGCSQSSLQTNMYKAPVFPHKVPSTDYLLVRSAKGKLSVRRIDRIAVVGQQEPLMEVFSPGSKNLQAYITQRLLVYVYREFQAAEKSGMIPWIRADELSAQFPNLSDTILRKKLKECSVLRVCLLYTILYIWCWY
uniref:Ubiquitin-like domain-containing protein n=1 Tax=Rhizophora mucronata TaxID=61149 RepID=A0A2P2MNF7_RHIMU